MVRFLYTGVRWLEIPNGGVKGQVRPSQTIQWHKPSLATTELNVSNATATTTLPCHKRRELLLLFINRNICREREVKMQWF